MQSVGSLSLPENSSSPSYTASRPHVLASAARYLLAKILLIAATIYVGVFATILIVNQPSRSGLEPAKSPFEVNLEKQINTNLRVYSIGGATQVEVDALRAQLRSEAGLNLSYWSRNLLWTWKALAFDWGRLTVVNVQQLDFGRKTTAEARDIVLQYFPNTLLLMGTSYLLVFLIGLPLSLYLARRYGGWLDRLLAVLWPLSSVPSWVIAILLVSLFAVELRWFPISGMFGSHKPEAPLEYVIVLARHMVLPVLAIVLNLLFQLVYTWRAFFIIHAEEDYVELGRAKGLPSRTLEQRYVLRPTLPYVITSFALTLIGFWQMTMALEVVFQWPGLGWLYITKALPNFWGESIYPGELIVAVGIVVIFAYLLGIVIFLLDFIYVLVDPRLHLLSTKTATWANSPVTFGRADRRRWFFGWRKRGRPSPSTEATILVPVRPQGFGELAGAFRESVGVTYEQIKLFLRELRRYPSAIAGACIIAALFAGSAYAVVAYPYEKIGRLWNSERLIGRVYIPRLAAPLWLGIFPDPPLLSSLTLDETHQESFIEPSPLGDDWRLKTTVFRFQYLYRESPREVYLYLHPVYTDKRPFVSSEWIRPDGTRLKLKDVAVEGELSYDFEKGINVNGLLKQNPEWRDWFLTDTPNAMAATALLFSQPGSASPRPMRGVYALEIKSLLFEPGNNVESQLVLLGQVYGAAGTDYWRRDLIVPLFWGMPFTLVFGLLGAITTTVLAILVSAAGAWFGGWIDALIQRFTEVNIILPALAIGVLANAVWGIGLWAIFAVLVLLNVFGTPAKTLRSAFVQARQLPYIEAARCYGASDFRIITRYLVPRILPVLIPQIVIMVPSFVFLEATLGIFNIKSNYPTWGRMIYEGLSKGALYGSRFWVLEPISLLLLTGFAFALMGSGLERILNPRLIEQIPVFPNTSSLKTKRTETGRRLRPRQRLLMIASATFIMLLLAAVISVMSVQVNNILGLVPEAVTPAELGVSRILRATMAVTENSPTQISTEPTLGSALSGTEIGSTQLEPALALASEIPTTTSEWISPSPSPQANLQIVPSGTPWVAIEPSLSSVPSFVIPGNPSTYSLHKGEFPYCIARRFNVDPYELLSLNGLSDQTLFFPGTLLIIPQSGNPFPGNRMLQPHPTNFIVAEPGATINSVACVFGDIDPLSIAQANNLSPTTVLSIGQFLAIP